MRLAIPLTVIFAYMHTAASHKGVSMKMFGRRFTSIVIYMTFDKNRKSSMQV